MEGDASIKIDYAKVEKDARLDGLKGYTTNSTLSVLLHTNIISANC